MNNRKSLLLLLVALTAISCTPKAAHLQHPDWAPDVKANVNAFMDRHVRQGQKCYAVFDFDNTSSIFDVSENQMFWQIDRVCFEADPSTMSRLLRSTIDMASGIYDDMISDVETAYAHIYKDFGPFSWKGVPESRLEALHSNPWWQEFSTKIFGLYELISHHESDVVAYNWDKYWLCGMTDAQVDSLSIITHNYYSSIETREVTWHGPDKQLGKCPSMDFPHIEGTCVTDNIRELWKALNDNGIDVWVCSASGIRQIMEAVDVFGLHDYCTGVLGMTLDHDSEGRLINKYDFNGHAQLANADGTWTEDTFAVNAVTGGAGKVLAIMSAIAPKYDGRGPSACFMDSTGDFNFCTEFASTEMVVCFNRADRKVTDGGGLIAEIAIYERDVLHYDLAKANEAGDIMYLLQGRDINGMRRFRPSNSSVLLGETEDKLFANEDNYAQYNYIKDNSLSIKEALETFSIKTDAEHSPLGFAYGFLKEYPGYRCK